MNTYPNYHQYVELINQRDGVIFMVALFSLLAFTYLIFVRVKAPRLMPAMRLAIVGSFYLFTAGAIIWSLLQ